jgi:hypothetical protein
MTALTKPKTASSPASAERQLAKFVSKFDPPTQRLIRSLRAAMRRRLPTANELVWDNYNFFVIGYSATERPSDSVFALAAAANGVGLSFYRGADVPDPHGILLGSGVQNRFIRLVSPKTLARPEVKALMAAAVAQMRVPLRESGRGRLIIRSVSATQRPRKKAARKRIRRG